MMTAIVAVLYLSTLYSLLKGLASVERSGQVDAMREPARWIVIVFGLLALLPVIGHSRDRGLYHFFLVFPLLYAVVFRTATRRCLSFAMKLERLRFPLIFALAWVMETFLAIDYVRTGYGQSYGVESRITYGDPWAVVRHLYAYVGFYVGLALVLGTMLWKYRIGLTAAFVIGGAWGVVIEQNFLGPKLLFSNPSVLLAYGPWTFITYGMYVAAPYLLFYEEISRRPRAEARYLHARLFVLLALVPLATWAVWTRLTAR